MDMSQPDRLILSGQGTDPLEPGEVAPSESVHPSRPIIHTLPKPVKFASSIKLSEAIVSSLVSPPQYSQLPGQRRPSNSDMEVDDYLRDDKIPPLAYNNSHTLRSPGPSEQRNVQECIQELAQALTSLTTPKRDSEFQGRVSSGDEDPARSDLKPDFQAYGDSAVRRCEQMITAMINDVLPQFKVKSEVGVGHVQGIEQGCSRCDSLEQRINVLEQQKLEEATLVTRMEERMEKRMEQMMEARTVKPVRDDNPAAIPPPTKRRRLNAPPAPTSLFYDEEISEDTNAIRLAQLESTVSMWEKRLTDVLAMGDNASAPTNEDSKSIMDRINALEGDSKQVFGYLSVHHSTLGSLNSALSLDPSKPLGQGLHRHLSNLRTEMAHMLTDVFGSLEDSLARLIVSIIIKQTKLEMQASYDRFTKELLAKIAPEILAKGKEPIGPPTTASASISTLEDLKDASAPEVTLPAIRELPSK